MRSDIWYHVDNMARPKGVYDTGNYILVGRTTTQRGRLIGGKILVYDTGQHFIGALDRKKYVFDEPSVIEVNNII